MSRGPAIGWSAVAWLLLGVFWFVITRNFHPTRALAVLTTTSLVVAYALAAYFNHLVLIPAYLQRGQWGRYVACLLATMVVLTALALAVIRISYFRIWGPDADPNGAYKHFGIDLFGMAVHLLLAAAVVWALQRAIRR